MNEKTRRRRYIIIALAAAVAAVLLALPLLVLGAACEYPLPEPDLAENLDFQRALMKVFSLQRERSSQATIVFTASEVDAILRQTLRVYNANRSETDPAFCAEWKKEGYFIFRASIRQPVGALNLYAEGVPSYNGEKLAVRLLRVRCGHLPLPCELCESALNEELTELAASSDGRKAFALLEHGSVQPDGSLKLVLAPAQILRLVQKIM